MHHANSTKISSTWRTLLRHRCAKALVLHFLSAFLTSGTCRVQAPNPTLSYDGRAPIGADDARQPLAESAGARSKPSSASIDQGIAPEIEAPLHPFIADDGNCPREQSKRDLRPHAAYENSYAIKL